MEETTNHPACLTHTAIVCRMHLSMQTYETYFNSYMSFSGLMFIKKFTI